MPLNTPPDQQNKNDDAATRHLEAALARAAERAPQCATPERVQRIGIVGAGTMGNGIATSALTAGYAVVLVDTEQAARERGRDTITGLLDKAVAKGKLAAEAATDARTRLTLAGDLAAMRDVQLVIEAVYENLAIKRQLFASLDGIVADDTLLASNTSTLDIDAIAGATGRPEQVVGMHFFSPANVMRLVEVVEASATSPSVLAEAMHVATRMGKIPIVVGNAFGFVGNRMLYGYGRENQLLLLEGAPAEFIDQTLKAFGMAMGPNAVGDLTGLDVGYSVRREWAERPNDPRYYRVADMLVEMGRLGQKTGKGMYLYEPGSRTPIPDPEVATLIANEARRLGIRQRAIDADEIISRCITALVIEGARLLESGIARSAGDIDVIWTHGYGFPRSRGGPMYWADQQGLDSIVETAERYAHSVGAAYWAPPRLLRELAQKGKGFADLEPRGAA